jgi:SAM-dependent methyltransferase
VDPVPAAGGEETRRYWNDRHGSAIWNDEPAAWLLEQRGLVESQARGRALDVACGGGRNALFLADLGFEVDALDISDVAVERTRRLAEERALPVTALQVDLTQGTPFPRPPYQLVIDFFYLQRSLLVPIAQALAPEGLLLFETFVGERPAPPAKAFGPRFGLEPGELLRAFDEFEVLSYQETEIGRDDAGRRTVARLAARRPSATEV